MCVELGELLEAFEARVALTGALQVGDTVFVTGSATDDSILISQSSGMLQVQINGSSFAFAKAAVERIRVDAAAGNDDVRQLADCESTLNGMDGNDTLVGGDGVDSLDGGAGDDRLIWSPNKNYFEGGVGRDTVDYGPSTDGIAVVGEDGSEFPERPYAYVARTLFNRQDPGGTQVFGPVSYINGESLEVLAGSTQTDIFDFFVGFRTFAIGPAPFEIHAGGGDDHFNGSGGEQIVFHAESGDDFMVATGSSGDVVTLIGGGGSDVFAVNPSLIGLSTQIDHGDGEDWLLINPGIVGLIDRLELNSTLPANVFGVQSEPGQIVTVIGDDRPNKIVAGIDQEGTAGGFTGSVHFIGAGGEDTLLGQWGADTLEGGEGNDLLVGGPIRSFPVVSDSDVLLGGSGNDTIQGGMGSNILYGENGDDHIVSGKFGVDAIASGNGDDSVTVLGGTIAEFFEPETLLSLTIEAAARLTLTPNATVRLHFLFLAPSAQLDLADNALILDYTGASPIESIRAQLQSGHAGGAWNGPGIASSIAVADARFGVGFAESANLFSSFPTVFAGQAVDDSALLLRYTRNGDADLNGTVDMADFSRLAANFNATTNRWSAGDFNYDGVGGFGDFARLAAGFQVSAENRTADRGPARPMRFLRQAFAARSYDEQVRTIGSEIL